MFSVERRIAATPEQVWAVLADGWLYPVWVVGASRMREVDDDWPGAGAKLHHSVGSWPLLIDDTTEVVRCVPEQRLEMRARAWPSGEAQVVVELARDGDSTRVSLGEDAVTGPGRLLPSLLRGPGLRWRNTETLRRLAFLAERRERS